MLNADLVEKLYAIEKKSLYDGADGEKIAAEILSLLAKEKLSIRAAKNILKRTEEKIDCEVTLESLL